MALATTGSSMRFGPTCLTTASSSNRSPAICFPARRFRRRSPPPFIATRFTTPRAESFPRSTESSMLPIASTPRPRFSSACRCSVPLSRPQIRSNLATRVLPVLRLLQQRLGQAGQLCELCRRRAVPSRPLAPAASPHRRARYSPDGTGRPAAKARSRCRSRGNTLGAGSHVRAATKTI